MRGSLRPPPPIEEHSKAKLTVLRSYLRAYFDRLNVNPNREEFKLDLVDGYTGGGIFRDGSDIVSGTPLIMLEESKAARGAGSDIRRCCRKGSADRLFRAYPP